MAVLCYGSATLMHPNQGFRQLGLGGDAIRARKTMHGGAVEHGCREAS